MFFVKTYIYYRKSQNMHLVFVCFCDWATLLCLLSVSRFEDDLEKLSKIELLCRFSRGSVCSMLQNTHRKKRRAQAWEYALPAPQSVTSSSQPATTVRVPKMFTTDLLWL